MEIVEEAPGRRAVIQLEFLRPFKDHKTSQFTFEDLGDSTRLTWAMYGEQTAMCKLIGSLMPMDRLIGAEFEKGLGALKDAAEKSKFPRYVQVATPAILSPVR